MISVVIPVYNEAQALPATLQCLLAQSATAEVILVDGGSTDLSLSIAAACPRIRVLRTSKGRATQMNAGARVAQSEWVLFLHADTLLPGNALADIEALDLDIEAGGFRHRFSGQDWRLRLISWLDNLRSRCSSIIYGDQAFFIRRGRFLALGGFPDQPILEDVALCVRLLPHSRPLLMPTTVVTDARKFLKLGVWRSFWRVIAIILSVELRRPVPHFALGFFQDVR